MISYCDDYQKIKERREKEIRVNEKITSGKGFCVKNINFTPGDQSSNVTKQYLGQIGNFCFIKIIKKCRYTKISTMNFLKLIFLKFP